jgi:hypothetical protein
MNDLSLAEIAKGRKVFPLRPFVFCLWFYFTEMGTVNTSRFGKRNSQY